MNTTWGDNNMTFGDSIPKKNETVIVTSDANVVVGPVSNIPVVKIAVEKKPHTIIFDHKFIKLKSTGKFIYAERNGVDSVAFILIATNASDERRIGVVNEFKPPIDSFFTTAFGGSIDKEKYKDNLVQLVIDEVIEEAGFTVSAEQVKGYGKVLVSTQMNQRCFLFAVEVDKLSQGQRTTTDPMELQSSIVWLTIPDALKLEDWKTATIISKRLAENNSYAVVKAT